MISAKTGDGVHDLFLRIIELIGDKLSNYKIVDEIE